MWEFILIEDVPIMIWSRVSDTIEAHNSNMKINLLKNELLILFLLAYILTDSVYLVCILCSLFEMF